MCFVVKYGSWKIALPKEEQITALEEAGYSPLTARVLCGRGFDTPQRAAALLDTAAPLIDPFAMREMDRAVCVIRTALEQKQKIAIFGDYDVDGITATCLLVDYLRARGADCIPHIPGRLEEGYGLNAAAIRRLHSDGVQVIVTVDCGITAIAEAELCAALGITLVITDHHECKQTLPHAAAVVDPHRPDRTYPHTNLSGVGIAFKLAAALEGDQERIARRYCDLFCLGTIADVMPLCGENRRLVVQGLAALQRPSRLGVRALIHACGCDGQPITAGTIGYILAPRINAAGRMEHAELAVQLFLSEVPEEADALAQTLCRLNRERQDTESEIYRQAVELLRREQHSGGAIVLAGEGWHQGVVGIVASRLSEEFCRPTFLICLDGERGKASSRSYGGFNLFASLNELSPLLEGYGGHELAAGFTILRSNIDAFRQGICARADAYAASAEAETALPVDCAVDAALLTEENIVGLSQLEPCGTGCPKPVFCLQNAAIERLDTVGGGKHLRLRLRPPNAAPLNAIFFSGGSLSRRLHPGDRVDVAFTPQIHEFRSVRSIQLNVTDLRIVTPFELYERYIRHKPLLLCELEALRPTRTDVIDVWNYLRAAAPDGQPLRCEAEMFCSAVAAFSGERHSIRRTLICLDILQELQLVSVRRTGHVLEVRTLPDHPRNPLENSTIFRDLRDESPR